MTIHIPRSALQALVVVLVLWAAVVVYAVVAANYGGGGPTHGKGTPVQIGNR